jgi:hypothetical protein
MHSKVYSAWVPFRQTDLRHAHAFLMRRPMLVHLSIFGSLAVHYPSLDCPNNAIRLRFPITSRTPVLQYR